MNYYDNVKDAVKDKGDSSNNDASFDTLKEAAEETDVEPDEEKGDETPIEVLEDGGLREESPSKSSSNQADSKDRDTESGGNPLTGNQSSTPDSENLNGLENKLDKIIEQNEEMIEILRSFGN